MAKRKQLNIEQRARIIALHETKLTNREIARKMKVSEYCVRATIKRMAQTGQLRDRKRSGRPRITTEREDHFIRLTSLRNRRLTAPEIAAEFNVQHEATISISTAQRRLAEAGLRGRVAVKKPHLSALNKRKRLAWAKTHQCWTIAQWKQVFWTDESKFEIFGGKRRTFVRRRAGERMLDECVVKTVKHGGGNVMVWGCFGGGNIGKLVEITERMTKEVYLGILEEHALPTAMELIGEGFIYQQDNDPKHTAKIVKRFFDEQSERGILSLMVWPPQSPDCNPIELLWDYLDREVRKTPPTSKKDLWTKLQNAFNNISDEYLDGLVQRMPRVCAAVIAAKGGYFDEGKI